MSTELSRKLRRLAPPPERAMWQILRTFREDGWRFRRQVQLGDYYVDFACLNPSVVIEVDGATHVAEVAQGNDASRDDYLRGRGFRVVRFWNNDVMNNPDGVYEELERLLAEVSPRGRPPPPTPPRKGEGSR
jgi:very-short-patch-repair endonuclease